MAVAISVTAVTALTKKGGDLDSAEINWRGTASTTIGRLKQRGNRDLRSVNGGGKVISAKKLGGCSVFSGGGVNVRHVNATKKRLTALTVVGRWHGSEAVADGSHARLWGGVPFVPVLGQLNELGEDYASLREIYLGHVSVKSSS